MNLITRNSRRSFVPTGRFRSRILLAAILTISFASMAMAYQPGGRWNNTAIDGSGLVQGDPTNVTWGFVADGTTSINGDSSDLIEALDNLFEETDTGADLTQRTWFENFEIPLARWGEISGVNFVYEPNDDGALFFSPQVPARGFQGVRADIRIGGFPGDEGGVLGTNFLPSAGGDMSLDTTDLNPEQLQNVVAHEAGHGLGFLHVESYEGFDEDTGEPFGGGAFLMEPFINLDFFGPQFDDILGAQRQYGDVYEKSNGGAGNDIFQNATSLGLVDNESTVEIGSDARPDPVTNLPRQVLAGDVDYISIDGLGDADFLSFEIVNPGEVDILLTPQGPVYPEGPQLPIPASTLPEYDTSALNNLSLQLFDTDGTTQIASTNSGTAGETESISFTPTNPGIYFVRIQGEIDEVQLYELSVTLGEGVLLDCDSDGDGDCDQVDIDAFFVAFGTSGDTDFNGDGVIDEGDIAGWLEEASRPENAFNTNGSTFVIGDANLDGNVDSDDLGLLLNNFNSTTNLTWLDGNMNGDGVIDSTDLGQLLNNFNFASGTEASAVPEPDSLPLMMLAMVGLMGLFRRR